MLKQRQSNGFTALIDTANCWCWVLIWSSRSRIMLQLACRCSRVQIESTLGLHDEGALWFIYVFACSRNGDNLLHCVAACHTVKLKFQGTCFTRQFSPFNMMPFYLLYSASAKWLDCFNLFHALFNDSWSVFARLLFVKVCILLRIGPCKINEDA